MAATPEDQRNAATIYTSLSSYVITASLGVIAAQAALATFVLDKREHLGWFYSWMVLGLLASVVSIVLGGKGIAAVASEGFKGTWKLKLDVDYFNLQSIFCLVGMALLLCSLFSGTPKAENQKTATEVQRLSESVVKLQTQLDDLRSQYTTMSADIKSLTKCPAHMRTAKAKGHK